MEEFQLEEMLLANLDYTVSSQAAEYLRDNWFRKRLSDYQREQLQKIQAAFPTSIVTCEVEIYKNALVKVSIVLPLRILEVYVPYKESYEVFAVHPIDNLWESQEIIEQIVVRKLLRILSIYRSLELLLHQYAEQVDESVIEISDDYSMALREQLESLYSYLEIYQISTRQLRERMESKESIVDNALSAQKLKFSFQELVGKHGREYKTIEAKGDSQLLDYFDDYIGLIQGAFYRIEQLYPND